MPVEIGTNEKHTISIARNWMTGTVDLFCDGKKVGKTRNIVGGAREATVTVGEEEQHEIRLVVKTPKLFAAFQSWPYEIHVDGSLQESASV